MSTSSKSNIYIYVRAAAGGRFVRITACHRIGGGDSVSISLAGS